MYGLVLEGGGAKGSYHIGVHRALHESGIEIKGVVGTSIGALNGAMIVQGDYEKCYELWNKISYSMIVDVDDEEIEKLFQKKITKEDLPILKNKLKQIISNRGFDTTLIRTLLDKYIDEDKIRESGIDFGVVTYNLTERRPVQIFIEDIPYGKLKDYLMASAYLPLFKFERIGGNLYLDGGFYDNLPFKMLIEKGYKDLILVRTHAIGYTRKLDLGDTNSIVISPSEDIGRSFHYDSNRARTNIKLGFYDGLRALKGLRGDKYYIEPKLDKDFYLYFLLKISEEDIKKIRDLLKLPHGPYRRVLLENIIPKICSILAIDKESEYEDILVYLIEKKAEKLGIDQFKIYEFEELVSLVKDKTVIEKNEEEARTLDKIIEKVDILPIFNKEEVILQIADIIFSKRDWISLFSQSKPNDNNYHLNV